jgi:hypothetical protein
MPARRTEPTCSPVDSLACPDCGCEPFWVTGDDGPELVCPGCPIDANRLVVVAVLAD